VKVCQRLESEENHASWRTIQFCLGPRWSRRCEYTIFRCMEFSLSVTRKSMISLHVLQIVYWSHQPPMTPPFAYGVSILRGRNNHVFVCSQEKVTRRISWPWSVSYILSSGTQFEKWSWLINYRPSTVLGDMFFQLAMIMSYVWYVKPRHGPLDICLTWYSGHYLSCHQSRVVGTRPSRWWSTTLISLRRKCIVALSTGMT
jgi:hypothetical protein